MNSRIVPAFDLGRILLTRGIDALNIPKYDVLWLLRQHTCCQWQMEAEDIQANMEAIKQGYRVFGSLVFDRGLPSGLSRKPTAPAQQCCYLTNIRKWSFRASER